MPEGLPSFGGLDPQPFDADSVARALRRYSNELTKEIERRLGTLEGGLRTTTQTATEARATSLKHASRHIAPGASGEDPLDLADLMDRRHVRTDSRVPFPHALSHEAGGSDDLLRYREILVADATASVG
jgi:hypothetical protein